jgi:RNA polymerase sigma-70 factor (ECF subfamily)
MAGHEARDLRLRALLLSAGRRDAHSRADFAELYRLTAAKLLGVALRILRRQDWAEDVLQESFVNIWNHSASYQPALAAPMTWMTSIVRNRSLDWLRRPRQEDATDDPTVFEAVASDQPGPLELLESSSEAGAVSRCLDTLDDRQRETVRIAFFEGLTHVELAERLGQPLGTVKTWVRRGLLKLKTCLEAQGIRQA